MTTPNDGPGTGSPEREGSEAGVYEYFLGGRDLPTEADASIAVEAIHTAPEAISCARENRAFVRRAARVLVERGIRRFVDVGCGYPTHGPLHEAVLELAPDARVAYVDYDPAVAEYAERRVDVPDAQVRWIAANLRRPWDVADHPRLQELIGLDDQPVAVFHAAVLHFVPDEPEDPGEYGAYEIAEWWRDRIPSGSYLVISHVVSSSDPERTDRAARAWDRSRSSVVVRTPAEVDELFIGCELLEPGLVDAAQWGASEPPESTDDAVLFAGIGRVP